MWVLYSNIVACIVNVVLLAFLGLFAHNGRDIYKKLHLKESEAISGKFQDFSQYQTMNDLDRYDSRGTNQMMIRVDNMDGGRRKHRTGNDIEGAGGGQ